MSLESISFREHFLILAERALTGCMKLTEISRVPFVRSKMPSLPSADALFVSRQRRSYQVSFSREEADSERSFELPNDLFSQGYLIGKGFSRDKADTLLRKEDRLRGKALCALHPINQTAHVFDTKSKKLL